MPAWHATERPRPGPFSGPRGIMTRIALLLVAIAPFTSAYDLDPDDEGTN